jgi:hypothetical protein
MSRACLPSPNSRHLKTEVLAKLSDDGIRARSSPGLYSNSNAPEELKYLWAAAIGGLDNHPGYCDIIRNQPERCSTACLCLCWSDVTC